MCVSIPDVYLPPRRSQYGIGKYCAMYRVISYRNEGHSQGGSLLWQWQWQWHW